MASTTDSTTNNTSPNETSKPQASCQTCQTPSTAVTLQKCGRCRSTSYCSKACQKSDWPSHKPLCKAPPETGANASASAPSQPRQPNNNTKPSNGLESRIPKPFTALQNGTWLHNRPKNDVFRLLIDVYRLRVEDKYVHDGQVDRDSIYGGDPRVDGQAGFRRYLKKVEGYKNGSLLPTWWNVSTREECIAYGGPAGTDQWSKLNCAVEKRDINEHYGDSTFAMQLRMFNEAVDGRAPGGADGTMMMAMMATMEAQGGTFSTFNAPGL